MSVGTPPSIDASSTSSASLVVSSMAPPRAFAWPTSVYEDPAVLRLDPSGRFILCRACLEHHDRCGGKTPKPVIMNARYRIRAWDTHKRRTRAHRLWPVNANDLQVQEPLRVDDCRPASRIAAASDSCVNSWTSRSIVCPQRIEVAPLPSYDAIWKSHVSCASSPEEASVPPLHVRRYSDSLSALSSGDRQLLQQISPRTCDAYVEPEPVMHQVSTRIADSDCTVASIDAGTLLCSGEPHREDTTNPKLTRPPVAPHLEPSHV